MENAKFTHLLKLNTKLREELDIVFDRVANSLRDNCKENQSSQSICDSTQLQNHIVRLSTMLCCVISSILHRSESVPKSTTFEVKE